MKVHFIYFPINSAFKLFARLWYIANLTNTLPHGKLRHSVSSVNFNFERTYLSRIAYGLRKATHGGLGKTVFSKDDFCTCRCILFNTSKTIWSGGQKVDTRVTRWTFLKEAVSVNKIYFLNFWSYNFRFVTPIHEPRF